MALRLWLQSKLLVWIWRDECRSFQEKAKIYHLKVKFHLCVHSGWFNCSFWANILIIPHDVRDKKKITTNRLIYHSWTRTIPRWSANGSPRKNSSNNLNGSVKWNEGPNRSMNGSSWKPKPLGLAWARSSWFRSPSLPYWSYIRRFLSAPEKKKRVKVQKLHITLPPGRDHSTAK